MNIIWYSEIKWDYLKTRKQHLLTHFHETDEILFFQPFSLRGPNPFFARRYKNIRYITLPVYRPSSMNWLNNAFNHIFLRKILYLLVSLWEKLIIWIVLGGSPDRYVFSNIFSLPLVGNKSNCSWDYNDDPEQFGPQPDWAMSLLSAFLSDPKNKVVACSQFLSTHLENTYKRTVHHIPNGVSIKDFTNRSADIPFPERRILGYIGVISAWFFDFDLVNKIAASNPTYEIQLYGPVDRNAQAEVDKLSSLPNLKVFAPVPYSDISLVMNTFRVGLVPLKSIPKVWQAASAKYLQYLAAGIPVVSTFMEQFVGLSHRAFMSKTHDEMLADIQKALDIDTLETLPSLSGYDWQSLSHKFRDTIADSTR